MLTQRIQRNGWISLGVFQFAGSPKISLSNRTQDGTSTEDIAWDAVAIVKLAAKPKAFVVALGDSYSAGEGGSTNAGADYYRESNVDGDNPATRDACHRSPYTWSRRGVLKDVPTQTIGYRSDHRDPALDYHLVACSGAQAKNVLSGSGGVTDAWGQAGVPEYGELPQLDQGYLDENTTLVTISIGGNDARFATVLALCDKPASPDSQNSTLSGDTGPLSQTEPALLRNGVRVTIEAVLGRAHAAAPNAKIVLMEYPVLVTNGGYALALGAAEVTWLSSMVQLSGTRSRSPRSTRGRRRPGHLRRPARRLRGEGRVRQPGGDQPRGAPPDRRQPAPLAIQPGQPGIVPPQHHRIRVLRDHAEPGPYRARDVSQGAQHRPRARPDGRAARPGRHPQRVRQCPGRRDHGRGAVGPRRRPRAARHLRADPAGGPERGDDGRADPGLRDRLGSRFHHG